MHPIFGRGIGTNVVLALARPSSPAMATVFQVYAFTVPLASRTAKSRGRDDGALELGVTPGLADCVAEAPGVDPDASGEVADWACGCPHAATIKSSAISSRFIQL